MIAVPIVLHLIMRRKPVRLEFPALRLIQKRADVNRRRLRLRHLLLLLLRAAAIALLACALARPTVKLGRGRWAARRSRWRPRWCSTRPRTWNIATRTARGWKWPAKWASGWSPNCPREARSPCSTRGSGSTAALHPDPGAAKERIGRLETVSNSQPLTAAIEAAAKLLAKSELRKEIYVLTDLSRGAWPAEQAAVLRQQLAALPDCGLYIIDVGAAQSGELCPRRDPALRRRPFRPQHAGARNGSFLPGNAGGHAPSNCTFPTPAANRKNATSERCQPAPGEAQRVEFHVGGLEPGVHQGSVRIVGEDGLAADDVRYFTVKVKPAWRILLAAPRPAETHALFLNQALAPEDFRRRGHAWFDCDVCDFHELAARPLADYAAVCLLDPPPLDPPLWKKLTDFAADGHGVAVFLGRNAMPIESFNEPQAQQLLAGKLLRQTPRPDGDVWLAPTDFQHPILAKFRGLAGSVPWEAFPVFRYWELRRPAGGASVVAALQRRSAGPAGAAGRARAGPDDDHARLRSVAARDPWNLLPVRRARPGRL